MQKAKTQQKIREAIEMYEIKLTNEFKGKNNKGKLLLENIYKLRGKEKSKTRMVIYDDIGNPLNIDLAKERLLNF